jgi:hypothetical protein
MDIKNLVTDEEIDSLFYGSISPETREGFDSMDAKDIKDDLREFSDSIVQKVITFVRSNPDTLTDQHTEQESKQTDQSQ